MENKPIQLILTDLRKELTTVIDNKNLPMCFITPIIKDLYEQCQLIENQQYNTVKNNYEASLKEKENKEE